MNQQTSFYPLGGGLDLITPAIALKPGTAVAGMNYEPGPVGYARSLGYERFDGRLSPTLAFQVEDEGGEAVLAREAARSAIQQVPGSGPVRGIWEYAGFKYAFRDNAGATACVMHRATPTGWAPVPLGRILFFTVGTMEIGEGDTLTGATSGATATVRRVVNQSGSVGSGDAAGYVVTDSQTGAFQSELIQVSGGSVATIGGNSSQISLPPGGRYEFLNQNFYGASNLKRMYGVNGVGKAFEFDGTALVPIVTGMAVDTPTRVAEHRKALFLAFPGGSVQFSAPGDPLTWTPILGAGEFAIGDEITDFIANNKSVLTILGANSVSNLYGNDAADFQLETLTDESGALPWTADKIGQAIYMDRRGIRAISSTNAYGNFNVGTMSRQVSPLIRSYQAAGVKPCAAIRVRAKDQYRIFFDNGAGLYFYLGGRAPEIMPFDLGRVVTCICSVETEEGEEIYFGSEDGFVYQLDRGTSFDGEEMGYFLRLPFTHQGGPQLRKRYHKVVIECDAGPNTTIKVSSDFDYGDPRELGFPEQSFPIRGGGGSWNISNWDEFYWSSQIEGTAECYLDGVGRNMSLLFAGSSAEEAPHLLQGITIFFTPRGLVR